MNASPFPHKHRLAYLLLAVVMLIGWLAATGCRQTPDVVKIGLVAPFEGRNRPVGYDIIYSARLAINEINAAGGVNGTQLALIALDDSSRPDTAQATAAALISDPNVIVVIGHWTPDATVAAMPLYQQAGMPVVPAGGTNPADPFAPFPATQLPDFFLEAYANKTPFDEVAGDYAGPAYDAFQLIFSALEIASNTGTMDRTSMAEALTNVTIEGITGTISLAAP